MKRRTLFLWLALLPVGAQAQRQPLLCPPALLQESAAPVRPEEVAQAYAELVDALVDPTITQSAPSAFAQGNPFAFARSASSEGLVWWEAMRSLEQYVERFRMKRRQWHGECVRRCLQKLETIVRHASRPAARVNPVFGPFIPERTFALSENLEKWFVTRDGEALLGVTTAASVRRWNFQTGESTVATLNEPKKNRFSAQYSTATDRLYVKDVERFKVRAFDGKTLREIDLPRGYGAGKGILFLDANRPGEGTRFVAQTSVGLRRDHCEDGADWTAPVEGMDRYLCWNDVNHRRLFFAKGKGHRNRFFLDYGEDAQFLFRLHPTEPQVLVSRNDYAGLFLWDWREKRLLRQMVNPPGTPRHFAATYFYYALEFSPAGKLLAAVGEIDRRSVFLWDVETGELLTRWDLEEEVLDARFSPDGRYLITYAPRSEERRGAFQVWDLGKRVDLP